MLKYNANVTRARHEDAGIRSYTWRTSEDERVRESHQALDGQVFRYDDPPTDEDSGEAVNPGDAIQCRCTADPVIPGYDDDGDASAEDSVGSDDGDSDTDAVPMPDEDSPDDSQGVEPDMGGAPPDGPPPPDDGLPPDPPGGDRPNRSEMDPPGGVPDQPPPWHTDNIPRPPGRFDDSQRKFMPREAPTATLLFTHGNDVVSLPEIQRAGRSGT